MILKFADDKDNKQRIQGSTSFAKIIWKVIQDLPRYSYVTPDDFKIVILASYAQIRHPQTEKQKGYRDIYLKARHVFRRSHLPEIMDIALDENESKLQTIVYTDLFEMLSSLKRMTNDGDLIGMFDHLFLHSASGMRKKYKVDFLTRVWLGGLQKAVLAQGFFTRSIMGTIAMQTQMQADDKTRITIVSPSFGKPDRAMEILVSTKGAIFSSRIRTSGLRLLDLAYMTNHVIEKWNPDILEYCREDQIEAYAK